MSDFKREAIIKNHYRPNIEFGLWWMSSKSCPEWNISGTGYFNNETMPKEMYLKFSHLIDDLGEPPDDLIWGFKS